MSAFTMESRLVFCLVLYDTIKILVRILRTSENTLQFECNDKLQPVYEPYDDVGDTPQSQDLSSVYLGFKTLIVLLLGRIM